LASRDDPDAFPEQKLAQERAVAYRYCFGSSRQSTSTGAFAAFQAGFPYTVLLGSLTERFTTGGLIDSGAASSQR